MLAAARPSLSLYSYRYRCIPSITFFSLVHSSLRSTLAIRTYLSRSTLLRFSSSAAESPKPTGEAFEPPPQKDPWHLKSDPDPFAPPQLARLPDGNPLLQSVEEDTREMRTRLLEYRVARLENELDKWRRQASMERLRDARIWLALLMLLLFLLLAWPGVWLFLWQETEEVPEWLVGMWTSADRLAYLRVTPDGRVKWSRADSTPITGRLRRVDKTGLRVNVFGGVVWRTLRFEPPADPRAPMRIEGRDLYRTRGFRESEVDVDKQPRASQ